jgi:dolichol-phosphate mannosyltransferase
MPELDLDALRALQSTISRISTQLSAIQGEAIAAPALSVILPVYNEEESLPSLLATLLCTLDKRQDRGSFEIIIVDDGSCDTSFAVLKAAAAARPELKVIRFRRNAGQTAAIMAGIDHASAPVIVTLDADLQNDPEDIPALLAKLDEGYDVVSGWRKDRQDARISRNFVSRVASRIISNLSGVRLHDYGCTLKAYRKEMLVGMRLYGEMHRFVPIYASWMGARVTEIPVRHHARRFGKSKYGLERTLKVALDLMLIMFLSKYLVKPIYVFGSFAALCFASAFAGFMWMFYLKYAEGLSMILTPLPVLISMLFLVGAMSIMMGILAEIMIRTYFESRGHPPYHIGEKINFSGLG